MSAKEISENIEETNLISRAAAGLKNNYPHLWDEWATLLDPNSSAAEEQVREQLTQIISVVITFLRDNAYAHTAREEYEIRKELSILCEKEYNL